MGTCLEKRMLPPMFVTMTVSARCSGLQYNGACLERWQLPRPATIERLHARCSTPWGMSRCKL